MSALQWRALVEMCSWSRQSAREDKVHNSRTHVLHTQAVSSASASASHWISVSSDEWGDIERAYRSGSRWYSTSTSHWHLRQRSACLCHPSGNDRFELRRGGFVCKQKKPDKTRPCSESESLFGVLRDCIGGSMGWLRLVGSIKLCVSFAEYCLFYRALSQKRTIILSILLTEAIPYPKGKLARP